LFDEDSENVKYKDIIDNSLISKTSPTSAKDQTTQDKRKKEKSQRAI